jgi:hypothetical protein
VVDKFAGSVRVEWDHAAAFTPLGQLPFFIDFLKMAGLFVHPGEDIWEYQVLATRWRPATRPAFRSQGPSSRLHGKRYARCAFSSGGP